MDSQLKRLSSRVRSSLCQLGILTAITAVATFGTHSIGADTLSLGGNYTAPIHMLIGGVSSSVGGGSIQPSSLNGIPTSFIYCVDLFTSVNVPQTYANTVVTNNGQIFSASVGGLVLHNAGEVAYLVTTYGVPSNGIDAALLQAAIWTVVWDNFAPANGSAQSVVLDTSFYTGGDITAYNALVSDAAANPNTVPIDSLRWLSPASDEGGPYSQGLVTLHSPEPATYVMLGTFLAIGVLCFKRKSFLKHIKWSL